MARLGIGRLILIDFDEIEFKNLNRIVNSTIEDARNSVTKVASIADALTTYRDDIEVIAIKASLSTREAITLAGMADCSAA